MKKRNLPFRQRPCSGKRHRFTTETQVARRISQRDQGVSVHLRVLRVSYENTFSAVISSPYLHLLAGLDRRKRIFIRYGEPQAHGNSVVKLSATPAAVTKMARTFSS